MGGISIYRFPSHAMFCISNPIKTVASNGRSGKMKNISDNRRESSRYIAGGCSFLLVTPRVGAVRGVSRYSWKNKTNLLHYGSGASTLQEMSLSPGAEF